MFGDLLADQRIKVLGSLTRCVPQWPQPPPAQRRLGSPRARRRSLRLLLPAGSVVDELLADPSRPVPSRATIAPELVPLAAALKSMKRANSGLTWIRQSTSPRSSAASLSRQQSPMTASMSYPSHAPANTSAACSLNTGCSPRRDELRMRYDNWAAEAIGRVTKASKWGRSALAPKPHRPNSEVMTPNSGCRLCLLSKLGTARTGAPACQPVLALPCLSWPCLR